MSTKFFEVEVRNRVVKGKFQKCRIKGTQGNWYQERLYFLADSEQEAEGMAKKQVKKKRILGIPRNTRRNVRREIEILKTRRIA